MYLIRHIVRHYKAKLTPYFVMAHCRKCFNEVINATNANNLL